LEADKNKKITDPDERIKLKQKIFQMRYKAESLMNQQEYGEIPKIYKEIIEIETKLNGPESENNIKNKSMLGLVYLNNLEIYDQAMFYLEPVISYYDKLFKDKKSNLMGRTGITKYITDKLTELKKDYEGPEENFSQILYVLSYHTHAIKLDYERCLGYINKYFEFSQKFKIDKPEIESILFYKAADCHRNLKNYPEALKNFEKSFSTFEKMENLNLLEYLIAKVLMGEYYFDMKDYVKNLENLEWVIDHAKDLTPEMYASIGIDHIVKGRDSLKEIVEISKEAELNEEKKILLEEKIKNYKKSLE